MQNILSSESPLMHTANRIADLIILNLLTILCSLPIFTIHVSMTALFACVRDLTSDTGGSVVHQYFHHWKTSFLPGTKLFVPVLVVWALLVLDAFFLTGTENGSPMIYWVLYIICFLLFSGTSVLFLLLYVNFENTLRFTLINAFKVCLARLPQTILSVALLGWPIIVFLISPSLFVWALIIFMIAGLSLPVYWITLLFRPTILKLSQASQSVAGSSM